MGAAVDGSFGSIELWRFACEGYLGALTRRYEQDAAMVEAKLSTTVDGEEIPFRMLRPACLNSEDRTRRSGSSAFETEADREHSIRSCRAAWWLPQPFAISASTRTASSPTSSHTTSTISPRSVARFSVQAALYEDAADRLFRARTGVGLDHLGGEQNRCCSRKPTSC